MPGSPTDDPNFEHRLLLAFALCVLLSLVALPFFNKKTAPTPAAMPAPVSQQATPATPPASAPGAIPPSQP
ncbi:MAG: hypothetical protein ACRD1L_10865, partial [Terriglobales bacterium]